MNNAIFKTKWVQQPATGKECIVCHALITTDCFTLILIPNDETTNERATRCTICADCLGHVLAE